MHHQNADSAFVGDFLNCRERLVIVGILRPALSRRRANLLQGVQNDDLETVARRIAQLLLQSVANLRGGNSNIKAAQLRSSSEVKLPHSRVQPARGILQSQIEHSLFGHGAADAFPALRQGHGNSKTQPRFARLRFSAKQEQPGFRQYVRQNPDRRGEFHVKQVGGIVLVRVFP